MKLIAFICLFVPAVISVYVFSWLKKEKVDLNFFVYNYSLFLISINFVIIGVLTFLFKNLDSRLLVTSFTNLFALKYLIISILLSVILPFLFEVISKNFSVDIEWGKENISTTKK